MQKNIQLLLAFFILSLTTAFAQCDTSLVNGTFPVNFTFSPNSNICPGQTVSFIGSPSGNQYTYSWNIGGLATATTKNTSFAFPYSLTAQAYTVTLVVIDTVGNDTCNYKIKTVNVQSGVQILLDTTDFNLCVTGLSPSQSDTTVTFFLTSPASGNFVWDFGDGSPTVTSTSVLQTHTYLTFGSYMVTVTLVGTTCPGFKKMFKWNTNPFTSFAFITNPVVCEGDIVTLKNTTLPPDVADTYTWDWGDGSPITTVNDTTRQSHVYTFPIATYCNVNPGNGGTVPYNITLTGINNCFSQPISTPVNVKPKAHAAFNFPTTICINQPATFVNQSCPTWGGNVFSWNFGDPASGAANTLVTTFAAVSPTHTYTVPGIYTVTLVYNKTNGCPDKDTVQHTITVTSDPIIDINLTNTNIGCVPFLVSINNNTLPAVGVNYQWTVSASTLYYYYASGSSTSAQPSFMFTSPGIYTISLHAFNNCNSADTSFQVTVKGPPIVDVPNLTAYCIPVGDTLFLNPSASISAQLGTISAYSWTFGNATPTSFVGANPGTVGFFPTFGSIALSVTNECGTGSDSDGFSVTEIPEIHVNYTLNDTNACLIGGNLTATFTNTSLPASMSQSWSYPGASNSGTSLNPILHYSTLGNYSVTLFVSNSCGSTSWSTVIPVKNKPAITLTNQNDICLNVGQAAVNVFPSASFTPNNGAISAYNWTFATGIPATSSAQNPGAVSFGPGNHTIFIGATNVCGTTNASDPFIVRETPDAHISFMVNDTACLPLGGSYQVPFTNTSTPVTGPAPVATHNWSVSPVGSPAFTFAAGNASSFNPTIQFNAPGTYNVTYTISNLCGSDNEVRQFVVMQPPSVSINAVPDSCGFLVVNPSAVLVSNNTQVFSYSWSYFGANQTGSALVNPLPVTFLPGNDTIFLTVNTSCGATSDIETLHINPPPVLATHVDTTICNNTGAISLWGTPAGGTWSGTNVLQGITNVTATYATFTPVGAGNFNAIYTYGAGNCTTKDTVKITVNAFPVITAGPDLTVCAGSGTITLPGTPAGGYWTNTGNAVVATFFPTSQGTYPFTYNYTSPTTGCTSIDVMNVIVNPLPIVTVPDTMTLCFTFVPIHLVPGTPVGGTWTGANVTPINIYHSMAAGLGFHPLMYHVTNSFNCQDSALSIVHVVPPIPAIAGLDTAYCFNHAPLNMNGLPVGGTWYAQAGLTTAGIFTPYQSSVGTHDFVYTYGTGDCQTWDTVAITVLPLPAINPTAGFDACISDTAITLTGQTPVGGIWFGNNVNNPTFHPNMAGLGTSILYYSFTDNKGCTDTATTNIVVEPLPVPNFVGPTLACKNATLNYTNLSAGASTYSWDFGDGTAANVATNPSHIYIDTGTYVITLIAFGPTAAHCPDTIQKTVVIVDIPVPDFFPVPDSGCASFLSNGSVGLNVNFTDVSLAYGGTYSWNFGNQQISTITQPGTITFLEGLNDTTYTVQLFITNLCGTNFHTETVDVSALPKAIFGTNVSSGCSPAPFSFSNVSQGNPTTFFWDYGNGITSTLPNPTTQYYLANLVDTTYNIMLVAQNACGIDTAYSSVLVHPNNANAFFNVSPTSGCMPLQIQVTGFSNCPNVSYNFGDGSAFVGNAAVHVYTYPGNFTLTQFVNNGCSYDTLRDTIVVFPAPSVTFAVQNPICEGQAANFTNTTSNVTGILWDFGVTNIVSDTSNFPNPTYFYPTAGSYNVTLTAYSSASLCQSDTAMTVVVHPKPTIDIAISDTASCSPFTLSVTQNNSTGPLHNWDFGNGQSSGFATPSVIYTSGNTYTVTYENQTVFGCTKDTSFQVTAYPQPVSAFVPSATSICGAPATISFTNNSTGTNLSYSWFFGNGQTSTLQNPSVTYNATGTFTVSLVTFNNFACSDTTTTQITVHPQPVATANVSPLQGCAPLPVTFQNTSINATTYTWDFGDASPTSNATSPNHSYLAPNTYNIVMVANYNNTCLDTFVTTVTVLPTPVAAFTPVALGNICGGPITVNTTNNSQNATQYLWDFDNTITSTAFQPSQTYTAIDTFTISLTATNGVAGCSSTTTQDVIIHPQPIANALVQPLTGCPPLQITANNLSTIANNYVWTFGDGSPAENTFNPLPHTYLNPNTYTVTLVANYQNVCFDTFTTQVVVLPKPVADFAFNITGDNCGGPLTVNTINNSQFAANYLWDAGNGTQYNTLNFSDTYSTPDTFYVSLTATNGAGCTDTATHSFILHPQPHATALITPTVGCPPLVVNATNGSTNFTSTTWNFGDGTAVQNVFNPLPHTYLQPDSTFTITLIANYQSVCFDTLKTQITTSPQPIADFNPIVSGDICGGPMLVALNNNSVNQSVNFWDFGNGNTSSNIAPTITYTIPDTFTITLVVSNSAGCADTVSHDVILHPQPDATAQITSFDNCPPFVVNVNNQSTNYTSMTWNFGDGTAIETTYNPQPHTYYVPDTTYTITLLLNYHNVCFDTLVQAIPSGLPPTAAFSPTITGDICGGPATISMANGSINASSYFWNFGDGAQFSFDTEPTVTYLSPGIYNILLEASNGFCKDSAYYLFTLAPQVVADLTADTTTGCSPLAVQFTSTSQNANTYQWIFSDGTLSNMANPLHIFQNPGTYSVNLIASIANTTCADTIDYVNYVTVTQGPVAAFTYSQQNLDLYNNVIQFTNDSNFATSYLWNFGDGGSATDTNPLHTYTTNDSMWVILTAYNELGCLDTAMLKVSNSPYGDLQVPNAFAPFSGVPGTNLFFPKGLGLVEYHIAVYTTWGEKVWESTKLDELGRPTEGWDGKDKNGELINSSAFVWKVHIARFRGNRDWKGMSYNRNDKKERIGTVTLIR